MNAPMAIALALHVLSAVVWVGGMFFAYLCLRPALTELTPAQRTALCARVLERFFNWVLIAVALLLLSGLWMIRGLGGMRVVGLPVHLMLGIGLLMMLLFLHVYFAPFRRLRAAVAAGNTPLAVQQVGTIRKLVALNLSLGIAVVLIATAGQYLLH